MIVDLDRKKLAEVFEETYDPNLLYEEAAGDDDDSATGDHHHHHSLDAEAM